MGELADDRITGLCCSGCGQYFTKPHGYPVLCNDCYIEEKRNGNNPKKTGLMKAHKRELR